MILFSLNGRHASPPESFTNPALTRGCSAALRPQCRQCSSENGTIGLREGAIGELRLEDGLRGGRWLLTAPSCHQLVRLLDLLGEAVPALADCLLLTRTHHGRSEVLRALGGELGLLLCLVHGVQLMVPRLADGGFLNQNGDA